LSYLLKNSLQLQARDSLFLGRYLKEKVTRLGKTKKLVICNSYPKSGTHLLYQILYSIPGLQQWDDIVCIQALCGIMNTPAHIRWKIGSAPDNSIVRSHLMFSEEILDILSEHQCKLLFIYRDLRDVAVSHARWVMKEERIFLHKLYQQLPDFDLHLMKTIEGIPLGSPLGSNLSQPDIGQDFKRWQGWLSHPETLAIRFEDLVGERGGGSEEKRLYLVERIFDHLGIVMSGDQIATKFSSRVMNPEESHTYIKGGKGSVGGWQKSFKYEHKQAFKRVAGKLLVDLGYETSFDW
jgi:hypothetical protein